MKGNRHTHTHTRTHINTHTRVPSVKKAGMKIRNPSKQNNLKRTSNEKCVMLQLKKHVQFLKSDI